MAAKFTNRSCSCRALAKYDDEDLAVGLKCCSWLSFPFTQKHLTQRIDDPYGLFHLYAYLALAGAFACRYLFISKSLYHSPMTILLNEFEQLPHGGSAPSWCRLIQRT